LGQTLIIGIGPQPNGECRQFFAGSSGILGPSGMFNKIVGQQFGSDPIDLLRFRRPAYCDAAVAQSSPNAPLGGDCQTLCLRINVFFGYYYWCRSGEAA